MNEEMLSGSAAAVLAAVTLTAPVFAGNKLEGIPLVWKPTELKNTGVVNLTGITGVKLLHAVQNLAQDEGFYKALAAK